MKRILAVFCMALMLCGCATGEKNDIEAFHPSRQQCLNVLSALDGDCWEAVTREFQSRSEIWVRMDAGNSMQSDEWDICLTLTAGMENNMVCLSPLVVVYNPKLVRMQIPTDWDSLLDNVWQGQIAFADPKTDVTGTLALALIYDLLGETGIGAFSANVSTLLENQQTVIEAVTDGSYCLGIVTESAALAAQAQNYSLTVLYPKEGTCVAAVTAQIHSQGEHRENAEGFLDFLVSDDAQNYLQTYGYFRTGEDTMADIPGEIRWNLDLSCWCSCWNAVREAET